MRKALHTTLGNIIGSLMFLFFMPISRENGGEQSEMEILFIHFWMPNTEICGCHCKHVTSLVIKSINTTSYSVKYSGVVFTVIGVTTFVSSYIIYYKPVGLLW